MHTFVNMHAEKKTCCSRAAHACGVKRPARASVCEPESCTVTGVDYRQFSFPIGRESTFTVDTRPIGRPNEAGFYQSRRSGIYASARGT